MENDESIKVIIRTPTSTRHDTSESNLPHFPYILTQEDSYRFPIIVQEIMGIPATPMFYYEDRSNHSLEQIMAQSMASQELKRNEDVKIHIKKRWCKKDDNTEQCPICQTLFKEGDEMGILYKCKHKFHTNCIEEWGKYKQECPVCRENIPVLETTK
jgi:hypothetical protein